MTILPKLVKKETKLTSISEDGIIQISKKKRLRLHSISKDVKKLKNDGATFPVAPLVLVGVPFSSILLGKKNLKHECAT